MADDFSDLFDDDLNLFDEQPDSPELDFEQVLDTQKQVKQAQEVMKMQAEAKKKQEEDNPRNWSSEQFKDFYKQNPPKNIEEQSRANVMINQAKEREKMMEDSLMGKTKESAVARLSAKALIGLADHPVVRAAEQAFRARPDAGKDLLGMEYDEPITSQVSRRQSEFLQQTKPVNPFLEQIASGVGRLAGETPGLVASFGATKGLGVGAEALSEPARRFVPQLPYYVNRIVHRATGGGLNRLGTSILQGLQDGHLDPKEVAKETAQDTLFWAGLGVVGAAPTLSQRVMRGALFGGATAAASGGSAEDIVFQSGLFAGFELLGGKGPDMARKMDAFKSVEQNFSEYMVKSGRVGTTSEAKDLFRTMVANELKAGNVAPTPQNLIKMLETQPTGYLEKMAKKVAQAAYQANPVKTSAEAKALETPVEAKPAAPKAAEAKPATTEPATVIPATKLATKDQADLMVDHRQASFPQYDHVATQAGTGWEVRSYEKGKAPKVEAPAPEPASPAPEPPKPAAQPTEPPAPKAPEEEIFQKEKRKGVTLYHTANSIEDLRGIQSSGFSLKSFGSSMSTPEDPLGVYFYENKEDTPDKRLQVKAKVNLEKDDFYKVPFSFSKLNSGEGEPSGYQKLVKEAIKSTGIRDASKAVPEYLKKKGFKGLVRYMEEPGGEGTVIMKEYVVFDPKNISTGDKELFQSVPTFYSQLEKSIDEKMPSSSTPQQVIGILNSSGVKKEEAEWLDIDGFLKGKEKVSKQELIDFVKANNVQIQEVTKGGGDISEKLKEAVTQRAEELAQERAGASFEELSQEDQETLLDDAYDDMNDMERVGATKDDTKFSAYQLPGGKNYREIVMTLPREKEFSPEELARFDDLAARDDRNPKEETEYQALMNRSKEGSDFKSSHFDEPNVIAHGRFNDRYIPVEIVEKTMPELAKRLRAEGNRPAKVLFGEEFQSDWHQKGRKSGYMGDEKSLYDQANKIVDGLKIHKVNDQFQADYDRNIFRDYSEQSLKNQLANYIVDSFRQVEGKAGSPVPQAPFKKTWHELMLKRMLRYAAENGYDILAWTTGEQQAERYDLSKQIEWVLAINQGDGYYGITAKGKGQGAVIQDAFKAEKLPDVVGKELAEKIVNQKEKQKTYSGLDLKVGGEGMKGFYDQILPSFLNKYTKKWGGRVGEAKVIAKPSNKDISIENSGNGKWQVFDTSDLNAPPLGEFGSKKEASLYVKNLSHGEKVHALDITPSMKQSVLKEGQPLFQGKQEGQPSTFEAESGKLQDLIGKHGIENLTIALVDEIKTPSGELAKGSYKPSERTVKMVSEPLDTTAYHEGFHVLAREARTSDKIADVIGEYKAKYGLGDKEAEEKLADDFARYANQKDATGLSARIKRFFDEILAYIRNLFGKGKARKLFDELLNPKPRRNPIEERLVDAIDAAKPMRSRQESLYTKARAERIARLLGVRGKVGGEAGFHAELGQLKGEMPKVDYEAVRNKFTQQDVDYLFDAINGSTLGAFESITAKSGLSKILGPEGGAVPTEGEIKLLQKVFGPELTRALMEKRTMGQKAWQVTEDLLNVPRTIMASFDLSAPLRQGAFLVGRPQQWLPAFGKMFKMFVSEKVYRASQSEIESRPTYELMRDSGLSITELEAPALTDREERFMSNIAEKIPGLGIGIRASGRAYTGFLNKLRADTFDAILKETKQAGVEQTAEFHKDLAKFINTATGRGETPSILKGAEPALNATIFSPKLMFSRLRLLNPAFYVKLEPSIRKEALRSLLSFAGAGMIVLGLAKLAGMKVGTDPRSADFGKFKTGDTRYDPWGGFQQPIVGAVRLLTGQMVSSTTGREMFLGEGYKPTTRLDIIQRYLASKEAPLMSLAMTMLEGKSFGGEKLNLPAEVADRFIPIFVADMYELIREEGAEGIPMALPGAFGVGVLTYGEQIPMLEATPSGKPSVKWRGKPSLGEDIVNKFSGKEVSNIPEEKWEGLRKMRDMEIQKQIALDVARRRVLETGKPQFAAGKEVYLEDGIVKKKEAKLDEVPELF